MGNVTALYDSNVPPDIRTHRFRESRRPGLPAGNSIVDPLRPPQSCRPGAMDAAAYPIGDGIGGNVIFPRPDVPRPVVV